MTRHSDEIAMREAEAFLRTQPPADVEAMQWHTRDEQGLSAAEQAEFQQWLATSPANKHAFSRLHDSLQAVRNLPAEHITQLRRSRVAYSPAAPGLGQRLTAMLATRRAVVAFCCVSVLAVGAGLKLWQTLPTFSQTYTAERGQRRDITLPEGSVLTLDTDTRVEVSLYRDRREVRLSQGQAMFGVAPDASRPFAVVAGTTRVTVLGTHFSVRCNACRESSAEVAVQVEEGHVQVSAAPRSVELHTGQAVQAFSNGGLGAVASVNPSGIAPWRKGLISFTNTPLAEAIQEFERYAKVKLVIRDPSVAAMQIGGSYQARNPAAFAQVLPHILPVQLIPRADGMTEVVQKK
jgi:transmembrane sensor